MKTSQISGTELSLALERLVRLIREISAGGGVSPTAATVLSRLRRMGPTRLTELARAEGLSQPGTTQLVTRMERDGLVHRTAAAEDRRAVLVEISDEGRAVLDERRAHRAAVLDDLLARLDPDDQAAIAAALPALDRLVDGVSD
ncbi:MarR family transcriptional regulator [Nocardioides sp. KR10-350]|uniref:MarR family winged helix-turn-helix transcriptional regulator n=1 Tax=Nocardioides cheoyonin TaxID=3156615 RepID=UPI0032B5D164